MEIKLGPNGVAIGTGSVAKPEKKKIVVVKVRPQSANERALAKVVREWNFNPVTLKGKKLLKSDEVVEVGSQGKKSYSFSFRVKKD